MTLIERHESNGAKATRLAVEHVTNLEHDVDQMRDELDECHSRHTALQARFDTLSAEYERTRAERDYYMLQAQGMKQALNAAAGVLVDTVKQIEFSPFRPGHEAANA